MCKDKASSVLLERMLLEELTNPIVIAKHKAEMLFVDKVILRGLPRFHASWTGSSDNRYFAAAEFHRVVERCVECGVWILGIEVFTLKAELLEIRIRDAGKETNDWCFDLLKRYERRKGTFFDATYQLPQEVIAR